MKRERWDDWLASNETWLFVVLATTGVMALCGLALWLDAVIYG